MDIRGEPLSVGVRGTSAVLTGVELTSAVLTGAGLISVRGCASILGTETDV